MKIKQITSLLVTFAALFTLFGAVLDLWFYTIAGLGVGLYVGWQFFAFRSLERELAIDVDRHAETHRAGKRQEATVVVTVRSNLDAEGVFTDVIPSEATFVEGENASEIALHAGEVATLTYTVAARGRADIRIETSTFAIKNQFFAKTVRVLSLPLVVKQSANVLIVEGGDEANTGIGKGALHADIASLHRSSMPDQSELTYLRPYAVEDPLKRIHWKASAKLNQLMTKEFASELDAIARQVAGALDEIAKGSSAILNIVIDQSASMRAGTPGETQIDFAINVASYLLSRAIKTGAYTGLVTYDDNAITVDIPPGISPSHSSAIVRALNMLSVYAYRGEPRHTKTGIVGTEVGRLQNVVEAVEGGHELGDASYFKGLVTYIYQHEEGYRDAIAAAPAFSALATCAFRSSLTPVLAVITDLQGDIDPMIEGLLLAASRGISAYVISTFSPIFRRYDDRLVATEDLYTSYELYRGRMDRLSTIPHVTLIPADSPAFLAPYVRKAELAAVKRHQRGLS